MYLMPIVLIHLTVIHDIANSLNVRICVCVFVSVCVCVCGGVYVCVCVCLFVISLFTKIRFYNYLNVIVICATLYIIMSFHRMV